MRNKLVEQLPATTHPRFLVYLMGPYKAFALADMLDEQSDETAESLPVDFGSWDERAGEYSEADVKALLERVRTELRDTAGLNAFLAVDADVDLEEMDAATQTIEFARASNVVAFVAPRVGKNLGVGIEVGSVLEALGDADHERVVFVHEEGVRSAMIGSLSRRWDATVYSYSDETELVKRLRTFSIEVMNRESYGNLETLDER